MHCVGNLKGARLEYARLASLSTSGRRQLGERILRDRIAGDEDCIRESRKRIDKFKSLLRRLEAWTPPTIAHEDLKKLMRETLTTSINENHIDFCVEDISKAKEADPISIVDELQRMAADSIKEYEKSLQQDVGLVTGRTEFVQQVRGSLADPAT
jgi:hypothetical protein